MESSSSSSSSAVAQHGGVAPGAASAALSLLLLTFNCARQPLEPSLLGPPLAAVIAQYHGGEPPPLIAVSLQEVAPLAYAFLGGAYLTPFLERVAQAVAHAAPQAEYSIAFAHNVGMTALLVFATPELRTRLVEVQAAGIGVGVWAMGNKGAVAARLRIATSGTSAAATSTSTTAATETAPADDHREQSARPETLDLTLVAAHLAPMEHLVRRRNEDWETIVQNLIFKPTNPPSSSASRAAEGDGNEHPTDRTPLLASAASSSPRSGESLLDPPTHLFVFGDLNYRTSDVAPSKDAHLTYPQPQSSSDAPRHYRHLLEKDQLTRERLAGRVFDGFDEAPIAFPPTYKYKPPPSPPPSSAGSSASSASDDDGDRWAWSTHRWPSWCDRVLFRSPGLHVAAYTSLPLQPTSDHQPVALAGIVGGGGDVGTPEDAVGRVLPRNVARVAERTAARRREVLVGAVAWLGTTNEGLVALFGILAGVMGGVYMVRQYLSLE